MRGASTRGSLTQRGDPSEAVCGLRAAVDFLRELVVTQSTITASLSRTPTES
jgi:hypothetical protein